MTKPLETSNLPTFQPSNLLTFQPSNLLTFQLSNLPTFSKSDWKQEKRQNSLNTYIRKVPRNRRNDKSLENKFFVRFCFVLISVSECVFVLSAPRPAPAVCGKLLWRCHNFCGLALTFVAAHPPRVVSPPHHRLHLPLASSFTFSASFPGIVYICYRYLDMNTPCLIVEFCLFVVS